MNARRGHQATMTRAHPKLVLVDGTEADAERARKALGPGFRVELASEHTDDSLDRVDAEHARTLLRCLGEGICLSSTEGRVLWANDYFRDFSESCQKKIEVVSREAAEHLSTALRENPKASPATLSCKFEVYCEDTERYFDVYVTPVVKPEGDKRDLTSIAVVARDVTRARRVQQKMDAIDRAGYELVRLDTDELRKLNA